jgi:hypothetical protein
MNDTVSAEPVSSARDRQVDQGHSAGTALPRMKPLGSIIETVPSGAHLFPEIHWIAGMVRKVFHRIRAA